MIHFQTTINILCLDNETGPMMVFRLIMRTEGFSGMFRGLEAMLWRCVPNLSRLLRNSIWSMIWIVSFYFHIEMRFRMECLCLCMNIWWKKCDLRRWRNLTITKSQQWIHGELPQLVRVPVCYHGYQEYRLMWSKRKWWRPPIQTNTKAYGIATA